MNLKPIALGLTAGIFCGVFCIIFMLVSIWTGYAKDMLLQFGPLHPWFSYSYWGALWMGVLHFIVVGVIAYLFALVYNKLAQ